MQVDLICRRANRGIGVVFHHDSGINMPGVASKQSYKSFVEAIERNYSGSRILYVFPKGLDYTSLVFYGGESFQLLSDDTEVLMDSWADWGLYHCGRKRIKGSHCPFRSLPRAVIAQQRNGAGSR